MSTTTINKVDMSLDDIIKVNKAEKKLQAKAARGARGASRGAVGRGRRGRGRGVAVTASPLRGGFKGQGVRGRGGRGVARGGRGIVRGTTRPGSTRGTGAKRGGQLGQKAALVTNKVRGGRGRGANLRGRGQRGRRGGAAPGASPGVQIFTNSQLGQTSKQSLAVRQQNQRLNMARRQAALLREKQLALKNLQQAQRNMQTVTLAIQKSSRDTVVNQMRGINNVDTTTAKTNGRGRRKLLASLTHPGNNNNNSNNIQTSSRQLSYTSVTIANPAAFNPNQSKRGGRRQWRKPKVPAVADSFKIEVPNGNPTPPQRPQQNSVLEKLKSLKPAVQTTYKFQKNVFAAPTTGVSLSDRFSSAPSSSHGGPGSHLDAEGRKVFV